MKKILSFIFAGLMLFSLAACGNSSSGKDDDNDKKNSSDIVEDNNNVAGENSGFDDDEDSVQVGEYITFGSYEQDNDISNGKEPIEWLVLDVQDGKMLVVSKYALDCKKYNEEQVDLTWETCSLRSWLNDEFISEAFMSSELDRIPTVNVEADKETRYSYNNIEFGNDTQDKIFVLNTDEANEYFGSKSDRACKPTEFAVAKGAYESSSKDYEGNCWWWLRSPGAYQDNAARVVGGGGIQYDGIYVDKEDGAVRPAMWIEF